jgi:hypothetical protein
MTELMSNKTLNAEYSKQIPIDVSEELPSPSNLYNYEPPIPMTPMTPSYLTSVSIPVVFHTKHIQSYQPSSSAENSSNETSEDDDDNDDENIVNSRRIKSHSHISFQKNKQFNQKTKFQQQQRYIPQINTQLPSQKSKHLKIPQQQQQLMSSAQPQPPTQPSQMLSPPPPQ